MDSLGNLMRQQKPTKPPAHEWQDFALRVINELRIPAFKRASVFKVVKNLPRAQVQRALDDTKELCHDGEPWKYFFKILGQPLSKPGG